MPSSAPWEFGHRWKDDMTSIIHSTQRAELVRQTVLWRSKGITLSSSVMLKA